MQLAARIGRGDFGEIIIVKGQAGLLRLVDHPVEGEVGQAGFPVATTLDFIAEVDGV